MRLSLKKSNWGKQIALPFFTCYFLVIGGCQSSGKNNQLVQVKSELADSLPSEKSLPLANFSTWEGQKLILDSTFIASVDSFPKLPSEWVKEWSTVFVSKDNDKTPMDWVFHDYFFLDSIRQKGTAESYIESADIGDVITSEARSLYLINIHTGLKILLWSIYHSSYEACPFTSGTEVFATLFVNGNMRETVLIAEYLSSVDAPAYYEKTIFSSYQKALFTIHSTVESGEEDGQSERSENHLVLRVSEQGFNVE